MMKKILSIVMLCAVAVSAIAVPARRDGMIRTGADGIERMVYLHGDETFHYMTDAEGKWLDEATLLPMEEEVKSAKLSLKEEKLRARAARQNARRAKAETGTDRLLSPRGAVILVSFADEEFASTNKDMTEWAMGEDYKYNGATGSIHKYFYDQSWGQYDLQIDVVGPVKLKKKASYYGSNNYWGNDAHADEMVVEACKIAHDSLGVDFGQYDSNEDDEVDWVVILYAGKGEADGGAESTIWPHQYDLSYTGEEFMLDGKWVNHYCCLNEIDGTTRKRCGIGTFCHEFSHVMGLPDFYSTAEGSSHRTMGSWDIMDYGPYNNNGNTPPNYSAYERWFMGWISPRLINEACSVVLPPLQDSRSACYMTANGAGISNILIPLPRTFYLFENRQKEGWDAYLEGSGMMITKVQWSKERWEGNTVNNYSTNLGVDIIEAKTNTSAYYDKGTDLYPAGATEFTKIIAYQVTNIAMANRIVTFDVNGGGEDVNLDVEKVQGDEVQYTKVIKNGVLYLMYKGTMYDVQGRRVN